MANYTIAAGLAQADPTGADRGLSILIIFVTLLLPVLISLLTIACYQHGSIKKGQSISTVLFCLLSFAGSLYVVINYPMETAVSLSFAFAAATFTAFYSLGSYSLFSRKRELLPVGQGQARKGK